MAIHAGLEYLPEVSRQTQTERLRRPQSYTKFESGSEASGKQELSVSLEVSLLYSSCVSALKSLDRHKLRVCLEASELQYQAERLALRSLDRLKLDLPTGCRGPQEQSVCLEASEAYRI